MPQITVKAGVGTTFLKTHPWQIAASAGKPEFKAFKCPEFNHDKTRKTLAVNPTGLSQDIDGHAAITFDPPLTIGGNKYAKLFVAMCHWEGLDVLIKNKVAAATPFSAAGSGKLLLPVTYRSQVDNSDATGQGPGWRQCQLTSVTMMLEAWKGKDWLMTQSKGFNQPEDWYASKLTAIGGETTDGAAHVKLLNQMGFTCTYRFDMSLNDLKELLDRAIGSAIGNRYRAGGHITYAAGKDLVKGGLYIHDPYGRRTMSDTQMFDTWDEIGGEGGKYRYHPIAVVKDCWLDMGDSAGWGIWPADNIFGHSYQKPAVNLDANPAVPAAAASSTASTAAPRRFKPQEFRANSIAAKFIGHFEGMELKQYTDCVGIDTIGIGTTRWHDGGPIPVGTAITKEEALAFFQRDAVEFIAEIQRLVDVPLTARQIAAVLSFCYNCGWQGFEESSVLQSINANAPFDEIRTNLRKWSKGDNGVLPGLLRRRNAEAMLWENRDDWASAGFD